MYDPFHRRIAKKVGDTVTVFTYADEGLDAEDRYSAADSSAIKQQIYGYYPDSEWTTNPVFTRTDGNTYFYVNDQIGTSQMVFDASGKAVWEGEHNAFGQALDLKFNGVENPLRFAGQYFDSETGLHYNWHRYYAPELGRYISMDPLGVYDGLNMYLYAQGNPLSYYDPYGLFSAADLPSLPQWLVDGSAAVGDTITMGGTRALRDKLGIDGGVDYCSTAYGVGSMIGGLLSFGIPAGALIKAAKFAKAAKAKKASKKRCHCFVAGTLVATEAGAVPIEDVEVGDYVWARDVETGENELKEVLNTFTNVDDTIWNLTLESENGERITHEVTSKHPYYVVGEGWVMSGELNAGDELVTDDGDRFFVESMEDTGEVRVTFNFEVADHHNYFVGRDGVLVHNCNKKDKRGHINKGHVDRNKSPDKSKFKKPSQIDKIHKKTVNNPDRVIPQGNRTRYEKDFNRDIGTRGERTNVSVVDNQSGGRVTRFPTK